MTNNASVPAQFLTCQTQTCSSFGGCVKYPIRSSRRARERNGMDPMKQAIRKARDSTRTLGWLISSEVESFGDTDYEICLCHYTALFSPLQRKQFVPMTHTADRMTWRTGTQSREEQWKIDVIYPMKNKLVTLAQERRMASAAEETYPTVSPQVGVTPGFEKKEPENAYADARKRNRGVDRAVSMSMGRTAKRNNLA